MEMKAEEPGDEVEEEVEVSDILPIRIGDYVTLRGLNIDGYLSGEGVLEDHVILSKNPSRFDDCVFQVCLASQYSAAKELANFKQQLQLGEVDLLEAGPRDDTKVGLGGEEDEDDEGEDQISKEKKFLAALERSKANEATMNEKQMTSNLGEQIKFGQTIQFKHRKSQKYLSVDSMVVASVERENLRVYLSDEGSSLSWFTLKPWFKIDRENAAMESNAAVLLQVTERNQEQVHVSELPLMKGSKDREVNCSLDRTGWRLCVYSEYYSGENTDLFAGEIVQLHDPEKLSYLRLMEDAETKRIDAFCEVQNSRRVNSNYLWMLERHKNPSAGGKVAYGSQFSYRLRHLNSGRYLCCRSTDRWKSSRRIVQSMMAMKGKQAAGFRGEEVEEYVLTSMSNGRARPCAVIVHPAQMHAIRNAGMGASIMHISDQSAITVECNSHWMGRGERVGNTEIFKTSTTTNAKNSLPLVIQRFFASDSTMTDIMVGVAALPFLKKYLLVVQKHQAHADLWTPSAYPQYLRVVKQLVNFLAGISLAQTVTFNEIEEKLQTLKVDDIRFRQQLVREQGVLTTVLNVMQHLVDERTNTVAAAAKSAQASASKRRARQIQDFDSLKSEIAEASCWLLRLAILDNPESQMFIADYLATLIEYVPLDGPASLATNCITHMLSTNVELQETKVKDSDIEHFINMIRGSNMSAAYLDLLRSVCSCQGKGVDGNQCRVVDLWLEKSQDLNIKMLVDTARPYRPAAAIKWFGEINTGLAANIMGGEALVTGLPHLHLTWDTESPELRPERFSTSRGSNTCSLAALFDHSLDRNQQKVQRYFVSQLYLGAEICLDRNYLAMQILEEQFPFVCCLSVLKDPAMPSVLKAAVTRVVTCVYLDADPQTVIRIPRLSHAYDDIDFDSGYSLPSVAEDQQPKFLLLQDLVSENLNNLASSGWDQYTRQQMAMLLRLVQFRFYSSPEQFHALVKPLVEGLDCRGQDPEADAMALASRPSMLMMGGRQSTFSPNAASSLKSIAGSKIAPQDSGLSDGTGEGNEDDEDSAIPTPHMISQSRRTLDAHKAYKQKAIKVYDFLDSIRVLLFILSLVIVGLGLSFSQMAGAVDENNTGVLAFEYFASLVYFVELVGRMHTFTYKVGDGEPSLILKRFICSSPLFNSVDVIVVLIDVVMYSYSWLTAGSSGGGETQTFAKAGRTLRLMRLMRIAKAARLIDKFNEDAPEEEEPDWEIPRRYVKTTTRQLQTMLQMIRILAEVSLLSRDFTLGLTLTEFKRSLEEPEEDPTSPKSPMSSGSKSPMGSAQGEDEDAALPSCVRLFSRCIQESKELSLSNSGACVDEVFLDLCLYAHGDLVQAALNVLMVHHSHRQFLLSDLAGAQLLSDKSEAADFRRLREEIEALQSLAERHELWGELESEDDEAQNVETKRILRDLARACFARHDKPDFYGAYKPNKKYQDMVRNLGGFETAMTVLGLHASIDDAEDERVAENTREICRLCNNFLSWFISKNLENQNLAYEEMQFWLDTLDDDINSGQVVADIMRGNSELIRQVPINIINFLAEQIIKNGHRVEYLRILEAMVFLDDFEGDNNTEVQFTILTELARSGRAERTMQLCSHRRGSDYQERKEMMNEAKTVMVRNAAQHPGAVADITLATDEEHLSPKLAYHCKLLEVLAGCAYGRINITTVETKLQNLLSPEVCLWGLLDPDMTHDVAAPLAAYFFHVVVEVEIAVPGLGQNLLMWEFMERIPKHIAAAASILAQPAHMMACADGPVGIKSRQQLRFTWFCIRIFTIFFRNYYSLALRHECAEDLRTSPTSIKYYESLSKRSVAVGTNEEDVLDQRSTVAALEAEADALEEAKLHEEKEQLMAASAEGSLVAPEDSLGDEDSLMDMSVMSGEDQESLQLALQDGLDEDDMGSLQQHTSVYEEEEEEHWIDKLIELLHTQSMQLMEKHQRHLYARDQHVLLEGITALRAVHKFPSANELPKVVEDEVSEDGWVQDKVGDFVNQLGDSEELDKQIHDDRTKIVEVIEALPKIKDIDIEADLRFEPLIAKLVTHAKSRLESDGTSKKLDAECTKTTIWIIQLFRRMIENKWGMTINERDEEGGLEQDIAADPVVQVLNKVGVTALCVDLIAVGIDSLLVIEAIKCCVAMLFKEGGNVLVQSTINKHLTSTNSELFFREIQLQISKIRRFYEFEDIPTCETEDDEPEVPENLIVLRFLQLMSEGHFEPNQDVVRDQPNNTKSVNLLEDFVNLLGTVSQRPSRSASETANAVTATILEVIQGPCVKNQEYFAISSELIEIMNRVLRTPVTADCLADKEDDVKKCLLEIFEGLTEGQGKNSVVFDRILSVIDLDVIQVMVQALPQSEDGEMQAEPEMTEIQIEGLVLLQMFMDYQPALASEIKLPRRIRNQMGKDVVSVEVIWNNKLQRRFFPVPPICTHIAEATKQRLVEEVDRTSQDAKLQDFVYRAEDIYREVNHQQRLSDTPVLSFLPEDIFESYVPEILQKVNFAQLFSRRNQEAVTWCAFVCALCINLLFLFTYEHKRGWISRMAEPEFKEKFNPSGNMTIVRDEDIYFGKNDNIIRPIVLAMNIMNVLLSTFTLLLFIVVRCPVKFDKLRHEKDLPFWWALLLTATDVMTLYYLGYTIVAVVSMVVDSAMHPFLLLDVIVKESTTRDVVKAVVHPIKQLSAAMILGVFVIYIFAMITFKNFASDFRYDGDLDFDDDSLTVSEASRLNTDCRTLWGCFKVSANYGMRLSGGTGDIMTHTLEGDRLILDLLYFLIVLVVLLNIIFGIIIDTFSDLRTKKLERLRDTTDKCFICGIDGFTFDQASSEPGSAFRRHLKNDHYMWNYLSFIIFIWEQDRDDDDGLELYVRRLLEKGECAWFPSGKALCLQTDEVAEETTTEHIERVKNTLQAALSDIHTKHLSTINELSSNMNSAIQKVHDLILHRSKQQRTGDGAEDPLALLGSSSVSILDMKRPSTSKS